MFLATNLRQGFDVDVMLGICVQNMSRVKRLLIFDLQIIQTTFCFVTYIARADEIRVLVFELYRK